METSDTSRAFKKFPPHVNGRSRRDDRNRQHARPGLRHLVTFCLLGGLLLLGGLSDATAQTSSSPAASGETVILALGDSLTAGYNLPQPSAFPVRLEAALKARGHAVRVINGGVSGDTTAGGLARLDWMLADHPTVALVELGANDALRGVPPRETEANLDAILSRLQKDHVSVLLIGMMAPPNMGADFGKAFNAIYPRLAKKHAVDLYPFFLDGVAANPDLLQQDGMHPTTAGVDIIVQRILPSVEKVLTAVQGGGS